MKIKFNGILEERTTGCPVCGTRRTEKQLAMRKEYILPSGASIRFYAGREYEVNDEDASFLLNYMYEDSTGTHKVFEKC